MAVQHRPLTRDGSEEPLSHRGLVRAAHTHHGGGRGLRGTPPARGAGPGSREVSGPWREQPRRCGDGTRALRRIGEAAVRVPAPHGAPAGSSEGLQDPPGAGGHPELSVRGCRTILGQECFQARG